MQVQMPRRVAVVKINEQMLAALLDLPEGVQMIGIQGDFMTMSVIVMLEGDGLPEREPGTYPVQLGVSVVEDDEGRVRFRAQLP